MLFRQFVDDDLGCSSYLVGDEHAGIAVVVDPAYRIEPYLEEAERRDVRLVGVLETHTHADHVSGHGRLALEHGLPVRVHEAAGAAFPHEPLVDGTEIELGDVVIRTIHTPGHRPEHCAFTVIDRSRGPEPWLVLTGDSLFVGDAARPDLAVEAVSGAEGLFHSLRRLVELGDGVEVFPGHVAGSLCGAAMSSKASTTIGFERRFNHALLEDHEEFLAAAAGPQPLRPPNMAEIVELNRGAFVGAASSLTRIVDAPDGAALLDVRAARVFGGGHRHGAVNVPVTGSSFATKAAFVLPDGPIVIEAADETQALRAADALHSVGILVLAGWREAGGHELLEPMDMDELEQRLAAGEIDVIDVREADEAESGSIVGARNVPYRLVRQSVSGGGLPVVTVCESGARAAVAASLLQAAGVDARPVLDGGVSAWRARNATPSR